MAILECNRVTYFYKGTRNGIKDVTFAAEEGDRIAVIGKNGAGKSTFLNMISGVTTPVSGKISCCENLCYHDMGFSSQRQSIDWYLNVYDNVRLGALLVGMSGKDANAATKQILDLMDLSKLSDRAPDGLSGGQQQRVQVARALVHNPKIMVLDEPTAGMDFYYSKMLFEYLYTKCTSEKKVALISSHDLTLLEEHCNKILFLENGEQVFFGKMEEFFEQYIMRQEKQEEHITLKDILISREEG